MSGVTRHAAAAGAVAFVLLSGSLAAAQESSGFDRVLEVTQPGDPDLVYVADVDGDDVADLITSDIRSHTFVIRSGDGSGGFGSATEISYSGDAVGSAVLDVDGDGDMDILVMRAGTLEDGQTAFPNLMTSDGLTILRNDGTGEFTAETLGVMGRGARHVFSMDLDGDDDLDLLLGTGHGDSVLLNDGNGGFGNPAWLTEIRPKVTSLAADFDGDGDVELMSLRVRAYLVELDGSAGVSSETELSSVVLGGDQVAVDVNGDGDIDLVSITGGPPPSFSPSIHVHLNPGDGTFGAPSSYPVSSYHYLLEFGDADDDGDIDIVTSGGDVGARVMLNDGNGGFGSSVVVQHGDDTSFSYVAHAILADVRGDALPELISVDLMQSTVAVFEQSDADPPVAGTIAPNSILAGETLDITLTGTGFSQDAVVDFGVGLDVVTTTFVSSERIDVRVSAPAPLQPGTTLGVRTVTLHNPDSQVAEFSFAVEAGPAPVLTSVSPSRVFAAGTYSFDLRGDDFDIGAVVDLGQGIDITEVARLGKTRLVVTADVSPSALTGPRSITITNSTGLDVTLANALTIDPPLALTLDVTAGKLRERKSGNDKLVLDIQYAEKPYSNGDIADPSTRDLVLRLGDPDAPLQFTIVANDSGWRVTRSGLLVWSSPKGSLPKVKLNFDRAAGNLSVVIRKADFVVPAGGAFEVDLTIGDDRGTTEASWTRTRRGFRLN